MASNTAEEKELLAADYFSRAQEGLELDTGIYRELAQRLNVSLTDALLLNVLVTLRHTEKATCNINNMIVDLHQDRFPEKWSKEQP